MLDSSSSASTDAKGANASTSVSSTSPSSSSSSSSTGGAGETKVTICHIPPGNPANAHTITVGEPAVKAHLAHGDYLGACGGDVNGSDGGTDGSGGGSGGGTGTPDAGSGGNQCTPIGDACTTDATCCSGLRCIDVSGASCPDGATHCACDVIIQ